ncbi:MAG: hypothetical protein KF819_00865 [Labilithrix sp.]|nr:hypothetical protein [Labilithrix sp.]
MIKKLMAEPAEAVEEIEEILDFELIDDDEPETLQELPPTADGRPARPTPRRMRSGRRVRDESEIAQMELDDTEPSPSSPDDWLRPSTFPTMPAEPGFEGYVSTVDEIRRLYAEGEVDAALDLAATVRPPACGFSLSSIPVVIMTPEQIRELPLDGRSGFFLARIDGSSSLQTILDTAPMSETHAIDLLEQLLALGAVRLVPPPAESSGNA